MAFTGFLVSLNMRYVFSFICIHSTGQAALVESMKNLFEQRKVPATITEKEIHSLASVLKV